MCARVSSAARVPTSAEVEEGFRAARGATPPRPLPLPSVYSPQTRPWSLRSGVCFLCFGDRAIDRAAFRGPKEQISNQAHGRKEALREGIAWYLRGEKISTFFFFLAGENIAVFVRLFCCLNVPEIDHLHQHHLTFPSK